MNKFKVHLRRQEYKESENEKNEQELEVKGTSDDSFKTPVTKKIRYSFSS